MPAPAIFGVEGRALGSYWFEWRVGPLRACSCSYTSERVYLFAGCSQAGDPESWVGMWQLATEELPELYRTEPMHIEEVASALESWLRVHVAELVGAMGLELRDFERDFQATERRIRQGRKERQP
jgi:hypothetical protein